MSAGITSRPSVTSLCAWRREPHPGPSPGRLARSRGLP